MGTKITWTLKSYGSYWIEDENGKLVELTNTLNSYYLMNEAMVEASKRNILHLIIVDEDNKILRDQILIR